MKKILLPLFAIILLGAGCSEPVQQQATVQEPSSEIEKFGLVEGTVVQMTDSQFNPKELTVTKGTEVFFINEGSNPMWPASDVHPSHKILPEFDAKKAIPPGGVYSYVFDKPGRWTYHNHLSPDQKGVIIVAE